jgi:hypothetical protein
VPNSAESQTYRGDCKRRMKKNVFLCSTRTKSYCMFESCIAKPLNVNVVTKSHVSYFGPGLPSHVTRTPITRPVPVPDALQSSKEHEMQCLRHRTVKIATNKSTTPIPSHSHTTYTSSTPLSSSIAALQSPPGHVPSPAPAPSA